MAIFCSEVLVQKIANSNFNLTDYLVADKIRHPTPVVCIPLNKMKQIPKR